MRYWILAVNCCDINYNRYLFRNKNMDHIYSYQSWKMWIMTGNICVNVCAWGGGGEGCKLVWYVSGSLFLCIIICVHGGGEVGGHKLVLYMSVSAFLCLCVWVPFIAGRASLYFVPPPPPPPPPPTPPPPFCIFCMVWCFEGFLFERMSVVVLSSSSFLLSLMVDHHTLLLTSIVLIFVLFLCVYDTLYCIWTMYSCSD